nr:hypothetical protein [Morchella crassipes]
MGGVRGWLGRTPPPRTPPPNPPPCIPPHHCVGGRRWEGSSPPPEYPPSEMGGGGGPMGGVGGAATQRHFLNFPPPRPLRIPPHHYPKGPWPSVKGRKSPPLSPQIFIFKFFPPTFTAPIRHPQGEKKKSRNEKRGDPPPPFQTITHVVVMKRGDLEKGGVGGPWVVGGEKSRKNLFII